MSTELGPRTAKKVLEHCYKQVLVILAYEIRLITEAEGAKLLGVDFIGFRSIRVNVLDQVRDLAAGVRPR